MKLIGLNTRELVALAHAFAQSNDTNGVASVKNELARRAAKRETSGKVANPRLAKAAAAFAPAPQPMAAAFAFVKPPVAVAGKRPTVALAMSRIDALESKLDAILAKLG